MFIWGLKILQTDLRVSVVDFSLCDHPSSLVIWETDNAHITRLLLAADSPEQESLHTASYPAYYPANGSAAAMKQALASYSSRL